VITDIHIVNFGDCSAPNEPSFLRTDMLQFQIALG